MAMNDSQLITQADIIKNETAVGANTATRVGTMLDDIITNKINNDKIDVDGTFAANSDTVVPSQKATKTYVAGQVTTLNSTITTGLALKENTGNKSNGPLGTSSVLFPTENSVATALVPKENTSNKTISQSEFITNGTSTNKYPSVKSVKEYIDGAIVGVLQDNGNYDPTVTSEYPTAANTLSGGNPQQGDLWFVTVGGTINGNPVLVGDTVRALIDDADPTTDADWAIASVGFGLVPEDSANKSDDGTFNAGSPDHVLFPTQFAVATYLAANTPTPDLQTVLANGHTLINGRNFQGSNAGFGNSGFAVNAFGTSAAYTNSGTDVNAFGEDSAYANTGGHVNAIGNAAAQNNTGDHICAIGNGAGADNTGDRVIAIGQLAGQANSYSNVTLLGAGAQASADDQLVIISGTGANAQISSANVTADRLYELPNTSGTIALLSDINSSIQSTVVTLDNAAIVSGLPMQVLPAPGAGFFIDILSVKTVFTPGGTGLASPYSFGNLGYGTFNIASITGTPLIINNTSWFAALPISSTINVQSPFVINNPVCLYLNTAMSGGVGNEIKVYITYQIVAI